MEVRVERPDLNELAIEDAKDWLSDEVWRRLRQKGWAQFASRHEAYGIIDEERYELMKALHENDKDGFRQELIDIAVACIIAAASEI